MEDSEPIRHWSKITSKGLYLRYVEDITSHYIEDIHTLNHMDVFTSNWYGESSDN